MSDSIDDATGGQRRSRRGHVVGIGLLATLLAVVGVGAFGWFVWLPHYRPSLHEGEQYGVDVSGYQGTIDWSAVRRDHMSFAYIKASEGSTFADPRFGTNWAAARTVGLRRGAYHFFTLCSPGRKQAVNFLDRIGDDVGELPSAVDLELAGNCHARPTSAELQTQLDAYITIVQKVTHRPVVIYLGDDFANRYALPAEQGHPLWLRRFLRRPTNSAWTIWQVDDRADVAGIHGHVDLDVSRPGQ